MCFGLCLKYVDLLQGNELLLFCLILFTILWHDGLLRLFEFTVGLVDLRDSD